MSINPKEENFKVWCQAEITKAIDPTTGAEIMRLGGIASTADKDSDDEFLDPKGFDLKPFMESGMVNWHHQAKGQPAAIIGEPYKAEIRPEGLYVEVDLYPDSPMAKQVYELAQTLEKNSKKRKLGFSIEGKVNKRKSNDKKSLDFKHILKAAVTGLAITHMPKNPKTFADIIKGNVDIDNTDDDYDEDEEEAKEEKALDTSTGAALKRESVDGVPKKTFTKSEVIEKLFLDVPYISIEKAEKIYELIKKISTMTKRKVVSDTDINKAYELLDMSVEPTDAINKGGEGEETADEGSVEKAKEGEEETPETTTKKEDEEEDEEETTEVKKGGPNRFDLIEKAIATSHVQTKSFLKALGVLIKESSQKLDDASSKLDLAAEREAELTSIIKAQDETISVISEKLEMFGNATPAPKSIRNAGVIERNFQKGQESEELAPQKNVISMTKNKAAVSSLLDQATFAKGYDNQFGDALMHFEATGHLPVDVISRIKVETGFEIVK